MKKIVLLIVIIFFFKNVHAGDSTKLLSLGDFLQIVKKFHPIARQAAIQIEKANAGVVFARGNFDPTFNNEGNAKTFDGTTYYQTNITQLKIPTWYGIEIGMGIEYLAGSRTDPQETGGKTNFAGISIPLAKNLLMDKRRAALQQAKIMVQVSEQERKVMLNDLMMDATNAYWQWVQSFLMYKTYDNVIELNSKRAKFVTTSFNIGESAALDTTEAVTQLLSFELRQNDALLEWQNATIFLNTFLWKPDFKPYELPGDVLPDKKLEDLYDAVIFPELEKIITDAKKTHPELTVYSGKLNALAVEKKLKFQEL